MKLKKENKLKINKGQLAFKIMAGILAILMIFSVCATCIFYFYSYITA